MKKAKHQLLFWAENDQKVFLRFDHTFCFNLGEDAIDIPALNQYGWGDVYWDSFFTYGAYVWAPVTVADPAFGGFSVAIAGTNVD